MELEKEILDLRDRAQKLEIIQQGVLKQADVRHSELCDKIDRNHIASLDAMVKHAAKEEEIVKAIAEIKGRLSFRLGWFAGIAAILAVFGYLLHMIVTFLGRGTGGNVG